MTAYDNLRKKLFEELPLVHRVDQAIDYIQDKKRESNGLSVDSLVAEKELLDSKEYFDSSVRKKVVESYTSLSSLVNDFSNSFVDDSYLLKRDKENKRDIKVQAKNEGFRVNFEYCKKFKIGKDSYKSLDIDCYFDSDDFNIDVVLGNKSLGPHYQLFNPTVVGSLTGFSLGLYGMVNQGIPSGGVFVGGLFLSALVGSVPGLISSELLKPVWDKLVEDRYVASTKFPLDKMQDQDISPELQYEILKHVSEVPNQIESLVDNDLKMKRCSLNDINSESSRFSKIMEEVKSLG